MRTRRTYYKDYGIDGEEIKRLRMICANADMETEYILKNAAVYSNPCIADELYKSLRYKMSYTELQDEVDYLPYGKEDFYGYQRVCVEMFRCLMIYAGRYKP